MILNGKITNPGELRTPITLLTPTIGQDAGGAQRPTFATLATVLAKWVNVHGLEVWTSQAAGEAISVATALIRYRSDVTRGCRVQKGSQIYEIVALDDIQERHEYIELKVKLFQGAA